MHAVIIRKMKVLPRQQHTKQNYKSVGDASSIHRVEGKMMCKGFKAENKDIRCSASSILRVEKKAK